jgi:RNA polymerase sigma-70 factor (ECF subfamily)
MPSSHNRSPRTWMLTSAPPTRSSPSRLVTPRSRSGLRRRRRTCRRGTAGPYALPAIAACHARASNAEDTDWVRIAALYDGLAQINPSPVVELNRGVAVAQAFGPQAGLDIVLPLFEAAELRQYHLLPAVAGDLLCRTGEHGRARKHFLQAASLTSNTRERTTMQRRAAECAAKHAGESSE